MHIGAKLQDRVKPAAVSDCQVLRQEYLQQADAQFPGDGHPAKQGRKALGFEVFRKYMQRLADPDVFKDQAACYACGNSKKRKKTSGVQDSQGLCANVCCLAVSNVAPNRNA